MGKLYKFMNRYWLDMIGWGLMLIGVSMFVIWDMAAISYMYWLAVIGSVFVALGTISRQRQDRP